MRISPFTIPVALILLFQLSLVESVSDDNICTTTCQYCCRNKECQSEKTCKGNYKTFIILGGIVGGIILLFVVRYLWVQYQKKNANRQPRQKSTRAKTSRWKARAKRPASEDKKKKEKKEKKEKEKTKKAKPVKKELLAKRSDEVFLNVGDNDSIITPDATSKKDDDIEKGPRSDRKGNSKNDLKSERILRSKNDLDKSKNDLDKSLRVADDPEKMEMSNSKITNKDMTSSKAQDKSKPSSSSKGRSTSASKKPGDKMTSSKAGSSKPTGKERGRSPGAGAGNKERSSSQKKSTSKGPLTGDKPKKNQV